MPQRIWTLAELLRLCQIHDRPDVGRALQSCRFPSMKADIGRFLLLTLFGGVWVDLKISLKRPFLAPFADLDLVTVEHYPKDDFPDPNGHLCIGFIAACPGHPVITETLNSITMNVNARRQDSIYHLTGATNLNIAVSGAPSLRNYHMIPHQIAWQDVFALAGLWSYTPPNMHWSQREQRESPYLDDYALPVEGHKT
jgi:mannosyltransferase OCH1-like enzyme